MTKVLTVGEIEDRLRGMHIRMDREEKKVIACVERRDIACMHTPGIWDPIEICAVSFEDQVPNCLRNLRIPNMPRIPGSEKPEKEKPPRKREATESASSSWTGNSSPSGEEEAPTPHSPKLPRIEEEASSADAGQFVVVGNLVELFEELEANMDLNSIHLSWINENCIVSTNR